MKLKSFLMLAAMFAAGNLWADDFVISSAEDWNAFCSESAKYSSGNITLGADIEVAKMFGETFTGTLDGQGHTITYNVNSPAEFALLKTTGDGAVVKNLNIDGTLKGYSRAAGVVVNQNGVTTIENVKISADITSSSYPVSGFVVYGNNKLIAKNCEYSGKIWCTAGASADVAGFVSRVTGKGAFEFTDCAFTGVISEELANGGVAGWRAAGFVSTVENINAAEDCYFTGCAVTGEIRQANGSERMGGFIGSPNDGKVSYIMKSCLMSGKAIRWTSNDNKTWMAQQNCPIFGCGNWKSLGGKTSAENCYFTSNTEINAVEVNGFYKVDDSTIANGALCYSLNGDQKDIHWFQTLGVDAAPVLDNTHKQVFASGRKHCDGSDYDDVTYNNEGGETQQDEHNFVDGVCDYCLALNISEDGYFHVISPKAWEAAVNAIQTGKLNLNIKLECDVEQHFTLKDGYNGTFDGQGHTIDVTMGSEDKLDTNVGSGKVSMFGTIGGATIRNCVFVGDMIGSAASAPIANYNSAPVNIENVVSLVNMRQTTTADGNFSGMLSTANTTVNFKNCVVAGRIAATKDAGGYVGWAGGQTINMENCVMIGDVTVSQGASSVFLRIRHTDCKISLNNCYYLPCTPKILNGNNSEMSATAKVIEDEEQIESGALCYTINGDQSVINFYQNLGEDMMPVPFSSHAQVYASGHKHCDGSDYEDLSYNNTGGETTMDEHEFENNVCTYCGQIHLDENGVFHICSDEGFVAFAKAVKGGNTGLNVIMEEDVNVEIGGADCPVINNYTGTFNGQGHTIDAKVDANGSDGGIFGTVRGGAYKNIVAKGSVRNANQSGFIGMVLGANIDIENVIVDMDIEGKANVAGVVGCFDSCDGKTINFKNVMFMGKAKYVGSLNGNGIGGFLAWSGSGAKYNMENCAMIGEIDLSGQPQKSGIFVRANNGCTFNMTNCAYIPAPGVMYVNGHSSEANNNATIVENATDGTLCWTLNGGSFQNPVWFQNLNEDVAPVLDNTHNVVYPAVNGYASSSTEAVEEIAVNLTDEANDFSDLNVHPAQKALVEEYLESVEALAECEDFEALVAAYYPAINDLRAKVASSQKAYDKLAAKVEEVRKYIEENADQFKGLECFQKLETYLSDEYVDPDEDEFPNGSYTYIIDPENLLLDEAGIEEEIKFIDQMLLDALNEGLNPGADATQFIANADFSKGFNAWEGTLMSSAVQSQVYPGKYVVESWSTKAFDMHQTITVPENGIYELTINGAYRIKEQGDSHQNSAMVYLNDNKTYLQAVMEDMISVSDAQDKVNAWITGDVADYAVKDLSDDIIGYTVHGQQGAACAFYNENPRHENRILVNVTDHTLTVGVSNKHLLTNDNEWVAVGNMKLTYCGTLDEAADALDATLASMKARAEYVLSQESDDEVSQGYPNYSKALKEALAEKVAAIASTEDAEGKYALVQEIGNLFEEIVVCKANYKNLIEITDAFVAAVDAMKDSGELSNEDADAAYDAFYANMDGYTNCTFSSEEAAKGGALSDSPLYPQFNEEGAMMIATSAQLNVFAGMVNNGKNTQNAVLTADVEVGDGFLMIGKSAYPYAATFDGQGHTITAYLNKSETDAVGIFHVTGNCTIKNLRVDGEIYGKSNTGAFVGQVSGKTNFQNVVSSANVIGLSNVGGFAGNTVGSQMKWQDCLWDGKVRATDQGAGGYVGWSSDNTMTARNCVSIGEVEGRQLAYMFRVKCNGTVGNAGAAGCIIDAQNLYVQKRGCIDQEVEAEAIANGTPLWWGAFLLDETIIVTADDMASGKICYDLNGGNTENPAWRQNLGEDAHPMLLTDHSVVYITESGNYTNELMDEDGIEKINENENGNHFIYSISGQRVSKMAKGLYIMGGKKYLVK